MNYLNTWMCLRIVDCNIYRSPIFNEHIRTNINGGDTKQSKNLEPLKRFYSWLGTYCRTVGLKLISFSLVPFKQWQFSVWFVSVSCRVGFYTLIHMKIHVCEPHLVGHLVWLVVPHPPPLCLWYCSLEETFYLQRKKHFRKCWDDWPLTKTRPLLLLHQAVRANISVEFTLSLTLLPEGMSYIFGTNVNAITKRGQKGLQYIMCLKDTSRISNWLRSENRFKR